MKTAIALFTLSALALGVHAQENDDMYFTSKDRAKLNSTKVALVSEASAYEDEDVKSLSNPTDGYSGRGENPEYTSKTKFNSDNQQADAQYFVSGYQPPVGVNQNQYDNSNYYNNNSYFGNPYNSSYYSPSYYGGYGYSPYSNFNSPYYGGYSSFGGFNSGWSTSIGYTFGMGSGFYGGMNYGYGNMWGSPYSSYYGYNNFYNNYGYGYGSSYYPGSVVIINNGDNGGSNVSYRRRSDRSEYTNAGSVNRSRTAGVSSADGRVSSAGRTSSNNQYYDRSWRSNSSNARSSWGNGSNATGTNSNTGRTSTWGGTNNSWNGNNNGGRSSSWGNDSGSNSRSTWSAPSNNSGSFGGGSRSTGGSSAGTSGGGGGGSRGRH